METINHDQISGLIRKNKEGVIMRTQQYLKMYSVNVAKVETKLGNNDVWCVDYPNELAVGVKNLIFDDFYPIALTAFNQNKSESFEKDVWKHLFEVDKLYLMFNDGVDYGEGSDFVPRGIAFRTVSEHNVDNKSVAYIEGTAVDPNYQGFGFYQAFTKLLGNDYDYVTSRTQNPVVVTALSKVFKKVNPFVMDYDGSLTSIGEKMSKKLKMENYNSKTMICKGFYGKALSGLPPKIDNEISEKMYKMVRRDDGDCILVVCSN